MVKGKLRRPRRKGHREKKSRKKSKWKGLKILTQRRKLSSDWLLIFVRAQVK